MNQEIKIRILECGLDDHKFSEGNIGGYYIQQDPDELAGLIDCLKSKSFGNYLSIGIAAGGTDRFICEELGVEDFYYIDDGKHSKHHVFEHKNKHKFPCSVNGFIGDSHSEEAENFLSVCNTKFDLIGIDGDHSPCGVRLDWMLIEPYLKPGTIVWLHDISTTQGGIEIWETLSNKFEVLYENTDKFGIGVVRV